MAMKSQTSGPLARLTPAQLYRELHRALLSMKAKPLMLSTKIHHSLANRSLQWDEEKEEVFSVPFARQVFQIQLVLERNSTSAAQRVIIFGRRLEPRSTALSANTQRATFNSTNLGPHGFYVRPQLLQRQPALPRALAAELPVGALPFWHRRRIHLGDTSARSLLINFLKATAVLEEIKGLEITELDHCYPPGPTFTPAEIQSVDLFDEGGIRTVSRKVRVRSATLRALAAEHYRRLSPGGRLRCAIDDWAPGVPVRGSIVEIHHDEAVHEYPAQGRRLTLDEALEFLFPLCPNCHRVLHFKPGGGRYTIAELSRLMQKRKPSAGTARRKKVGSN